MDEKIVELFDGINLHFINTKRFKTDFIACFMFTELNRECVTKNALIPAVLTRGTEKMPTMKDINMYLEKNYGSILDASSNKNGDKQVLQFYTTSVNNKYTFNNEDMLEKSIELICDVMLNPKLENGIFCSEYVNQEKEVIRDLIKSKINNKGAYADFRCIEELCKGEPFGLYKYGYEEDLEGITASNLYDQYKNILSNSEIHIYVSGDFDEGKVFGNFKKRFEVISRNYNASQILAKKNDSKELRIVTDVQDVAQGKLVIGLRAKDINLINDMYSFIVFNAILGGTASSKLFQNVREKASLAYTTRSSYIKHKGIVLISSGIEINNYEKALELIKVQVQDMKNGNFSEEDIKDAKASLENAYRSYLDEQSAIINLYMGQHILGCDDSVQQIIDNIQNVSKEEIVNVARKLEAKVIYFLKNKS